MKVLVGLFNAECNANMPVMSDLSTFDLAFGEQVIAKLYIKDVYDQAGVELIPAVCQCWSNRYCGKGIVRGD